MTDGPIVELIPKEAAREVVKETAKLTREIGGFLGKVFGTLPHDAVWVLGGDWLHHVRIRNAHRLQLRTEEILRERNAENNTEPLSPSEAIPLLRAAQDKSRPELRELWARLLANAMGRRRPQITRILISVLEELDVLEARIIHRLIDEDALGNRNHRSGEQAQLAAQHHKLGTHRLDRPAIVLAEVGNRLEVRRQPPGQPHQFGIALRFPLEAPARLHAVEIAVEIDLQ